jgi:plastocyanin
MKTTFYAGSIAIVAMMILIIISISASALLSTQTVIASIDEQDDSATTNTTNMTTVTSNNNTTTPIAPYNATQLIAVGAGNMNISINQFLPQTAEIQPGESVTFFAPNGTTEIHNVIFDLSNGTIISGIGVPFTLPSGVSGEVPTDVSEELLPAPPYNLGEPIIQNTTDGTPALVGFNKIAFYPAVVDQNGNVIYLEEEEIRHQMEESMQQGMVIPPQLSASYTMDGTEKVVSSGIILDVTGFAPLEEEEGGVQEQQQQTPTSEEGFPPPAYPMLSSFTVTFEEPGTYDYFCAFHPGMFGQVVVGGGGEGETNQTSSTATTTPSMMQPLT